MAGLYVFFHLPFALWSLLATKTADCVRTKWSRNPLLVPKSRVSVREIKDASACSETISANHPLAKLLYKSY